MKAFRLGSLFAISLVLAGLSGCKSTPKNITPVLGSANADTAATAAAGSNLDESLGIPGALVESRFGSQSARPSLERRLPAVLSDPGDELWVIYRPESRALKASADEEYPGTGALMTRVADREVPLPLKHTDVRASVSAMIASVTVEQQFHNPFDEKIEAVYVFPLPENGAVNEFVMTVGQRRIRGIIRERKEAEQIYQEARRQGYVASLMTQERPNIFTQSVANIEPGREIAISIRYYNTLAYADGWYEFVFPMVVGPRFNPPGNSKGIGAVSKSGLDTSGQSTDVHYLKPAERSGHDISIQLDLRPGVKIEEFACKTHAVTIKNSGLIDETWHPLENLSEAVDHLSVRLDPRDSIPNKDFVFRYRVAGRQVKASFVTHEDTRGGFFTMMIYPPALLESLDRSPVELVFVLDCSGSMAGQPLKQAKAAIEWALRHMDSRDTFQIVKFSDHAEQLSDYPLRATPANAQAGLRYLDQLHSGGGTMMLSGLRAALSSPRDLTRLRFVCFLTDGYIGNEAQILSEIQRSLGDSRIFSFGVGSSVNRYLMEGMAKVGRGAVAYLGPKESGAEVMENLFERISHPGMTDVRIDWGDLNVTDVYPKRLPDLFVGRPVIVTGRYRSGTREKSSIQLFGRTSNGTEARIEVPVQLASSVAESSQALPSIWARMKIAELTERSRFEPGAFAASQIRQTALDFALISPYTAFIALDASERTGGRTGTTIPVAVPVPEGVKYENTVNE